MATRKYFPLLAFACLLIVSVYSYGYLLGTNYGHQQAQESLEQVEKVSEQIRRGGTVVTRAVDSFKRLLIK